MFSGERFSQINPELKQPILETEIADFPGRGIIAVYHILLMKAALTHTTNGGSPHEFVSEYNIDFSKNDDTCGFHADLIPLQERGLYLPVIKSRHEEFRGERGHFFHRDHLNTSQSYLYSYYKQDPTPRNRDINNMCFDLCDIPWNESDFGNTERLQNGLMLGQLLWLGDLRIFREYEKPKLKEPKRKLAEGLIFYYEQQIGPIEIKWDLPEK